MTYKAGIEMADYLMEKGCDVDTDFSDTGNHVKFGLVMFTAGTIMRMEEILGGDISEYEQQLQQFTNGDGFNADIDI